MKTALQIILLRTELLKTGRPKNTPRRTLTSERIRALQIVQSKTTKSKSWVKKKAQERARKSQTRMGLYKIRTKTEPLMKNSCVKEGLRKSPKSNKSPRRERSHRYQMIQRTELVRRRMGGTKSHQKKKQTQKQAEEKESVTRSV